MGHGTVLEAGPPDELLAQRGHFWELYDAQTDGQSFNSMKSSQT